MLIFYRGFSSSHCLLLDQFQPECRMFPKREHFQRAIFKFFFHYFHPCAPPLCADPAWTSAGQWKMQCAAPLRGCSRATARRWHSCERSACPTDLLRSVHVRFRIVLVCAKSQVWALWLSFRASAFPTGGVLQAEHWDLIWLVLELNSTGCNRATTKRITLIFLFRDKFPHHVHLVRLASKAMTFLYKLLVWRMQVCLQEENSRTWFL